MQVVIVNTDKTRKAFLDLVDVIYANEPAYIRPLDGTVERVFDVEKNAYFNHGKAIRFLLLDEGKTIGRIAAFVNYKKASGYDQPTGGLGFFECVNNQEAAFALFEVAKNWLIKQEMEAMDGPINFGENDNFWGLLVEGFTQPGFGMQYNPSYYQAFFESYGFETYYEQVTNHLDITKPFPERFWKIAGWVVQKKDYHFKCFSWNEMDRFISDFETVYNDAWQFHENFTPIEKKVLRKSLQQARPFLQEDLIWFAYYKNEPIGLIVMLPDVNQIIKRLNGRLNWFNKCRFMVMKYFKFMTRIRVVVLGVRPKYQRSGIESGLFWQIKNVVDKNPHFKEMELSWVGDFNPKMRALQESMGAVFGKRHITYRCIFDPSKRGNVHSESIAVDTKYKKETRKA